MTRAGVLAAAVLAAAALAPPARASFGAPAQLDGRLVRHRRGGRHRRRRLDDRARLRLRPRSAPVRAPVRRRLVGGDAAAGRPRGHGRPGRRRRRPGALGIAWRVDKPRAYTGIAVAMRDPGGDAERADPDRRRRRRRRAPPGACDRPRRRRAAGLQRRDAAQVHLNLRGAIAITYRKGGGSFAPPTVVDRRCRARRPSPSGATARASWRGRTTAGVYVVSVSADGQIGKVKRIASPEGVVGARRGRRRGRGGHAGVGQPSRRRHGPQPAHPLLRARPRPDRGARLRGRRHGRLDQRLRARRQHRRRRGRPGDAGLEPASTSASDRSVGNSGITSAILATTARAGEAVPGAARRSRSGAAAT